MVMTKNAWILRKERYGLTGSKNSEITKQKRRIAMIGKKFPNRKPHKTTERMIKCGREIGKRSKPKDDKSVHWKGDKVGYFGLHNWVYKKLGKAIKCQFCGETKGKIEWANKSWKYKREKNDWISLCTPCHRGYDSNYKKVSL